MARIFMLLLAVAMVFAVAIPAVAQEGDAAATPVVASSFPGIVLGVGFGTGIIILGAGFGIGRIGSAAVESMARQPEVAGNIQTAMLISAALIEGATFFALIVLIMKG